jgi:hypothetical protein
MFHQPFLKIKKLYFYNFIRSRIQQLKLMRIYIRKSLMLLRQILVFFRDFFHICRDYEIHFHTTTYLTTTYHIERVLQRFWVLHVQHSSCITLLRSSIIWIGEWRPTRLSADLHVSYQQLMSPLVKNRFSVPPTPPTRWALHSSWLSRTRTYEKA